MSHVGAESGSAATTIASQLCGTGRTADYTFGVAVSATANITTVENALQSWNRSTCVTSFKRTSGLGGLTIWQSSKNLNNLTSRQKNKAFADVLSRFRAVLVAVRHQEPLVKRYSRTMTRRTFGAAAYAGSRCWWTMTAAHPRPRALRDIAQRLHQVQPGQ